MTDDHTRRMVLGDHAESRLAASGEHEHTYPRDEQPFDVDAFVDRFVADANRLRRWSWVVLLAAGAAVGVVLGIVL